MLDKILSAIKSPPTGTGTRKEVAAAALMVEAARLDRTFDEGERATITKLVGEQFNLSSEDAGELVNIAEKTQRANYSDWIFIKTVNESFSAEDKQELMVMLWKVAYADGNLHRFEEHLIEHVAKELAISDADIKKAQDAAR